MNCEGLTNCELILDMVSGYCVLIGCLLSVTDSLACPTLDCRISNAFLGYEGLKFSSQLSLRKMLDQCWVLFVLLLVYVTTVGGFVPKHSKSINTFATHSSIPAFDYRSEVKLPWQSQGYSTWLWNGYKINYVDLGGGEADDGLNKQPLLLIHGFGASVYHWRYNIPFLARKYHVYAIDMVGFGLSDKPIIDYSAELWRDQVLSFIEEVVMRDRQIDDRVPCVVAGNSLGGFTALYASSSEKAVSNRLIGGCILLNAAGRFRSDESVVEKEPLPKWVIALQSFFQRLVIGMSFLYTKQPQRIAQVKELIALASDALSYTLLYCSVGASSGLSGGSP